MKKSNSLEVLFENSSNLSDPLTSMINHKQFCKKFHSGKEVAADMDKSGKIEINISE